MVTDAPSHTKTDTLLINGTALAVGNSAVLLRGPSGSGKSDLALRCLFMPPATIKGEAVRLISDDYILLSRLNDRVVASAPQTIRGQIEVRGLGLYSMPTLDSVDLVLVADLVQRDEVERMPDPLPYEEFLGLAVPVVKMAPFEASAAHKLMMAVLYGIPRSEV